MPVSPEYSKAKTPTHSRDNDSFILGDLDCKGGGDPKECNFSSSGGRVCRDVLLSITVYDINDSCKNKTVHHGGCAFCPEEHIYKDEQKCLRCLN